MRQVEQMVENELFYQHVVEEIFGDSLPSDGCGEMLLGVFSQGETLQGRPKGGSGSHCFLFLE